MDEHQSECLDTHLQEALPRGTPRCLGLQVGELIKDQAGAWIVQLLGWGKRTAICKGEPSLLQCQTSIHLPTSVLLTAGAPKALKS